MNRATRCSGQKNNPTEKIVEPWFTLQSGVKFYPFSPTMDMIDIQDIAHGLSMICRWGGHCREFYSVASHSNFVSMLGRNSEEWKWGLLHDAAEAYVGDVIRPIKRSIPHFKTIENNIHRVILQKFGLMWPGDININIPDWIKHCDNVAMVTEARDLMHGPISDVNLPDPVPAKIKCLSPKQSRIQFLYAFNTLFPEHAVGPEDE